MRGGGSTRGVRSRPRKSELAGLTKNKILRICTTGWYFYNDKVVDTGDIIYENYDRTWSPCGNWLETLVAYHSYWQSLSQSV